MVKSRSKGGIPTYAKVVIAILGSLVLLFLVYIIYNVSTQTNITPTQPPAGSAPHTPPCTPPTTPGTPPTPPGTPVGYSCSIPTSSGARMCMDDFNCMWTFKAWENQSRSDGQCVTRVATTPIKKSDGGVVPDEQGCDVFNNGKKQSHIWCNANPGRCWWNQSTNMCETRCLDATGTTPAGCKTFSN